MSEYIKASQVFLDNPATNVDEVLEFLADKAIEAGLSDDRAAVLEAFKAREAMGTTGMQGGFAIPHCKSSAVNDAAIFVVKFANKVGWPPPTQTPSPTSSTALLVHKTLS